MTQTQQTLAISGASGQLGRRITELLLQSNAGKVVAITRSPEKLADLAAKGADVRRADFDDAKSLVTAFAGVDHLLIISTDSLERRAQQQIAAVEAATQAGVSHILYTSIVGAESGLPPAIAPSHYATEQAMAKSPLSWTVLRNNLYTDQFLQSLPYAIATGKFMAATAQAGVGYVTREDCARTAASVLASTDTSCKTLDVTGPSIVTGTEIAKILSEVVGKTIAYVPITLEQKTAGLAASGLPQFMAEMVASFDDAVARGLLSVKSNTVTELTGRPAQSVKDFLIANRAALMPH